MGIVIILSVIFNQDIAYNGYKPISKSKYFFFGVLSIAPFNYYFKKKIDNEIKIKYLLYTFCIATTIASLSGLIGVFIGFNLSTFHWGDLGRNAGFFGMVMNYAHNLAYFLIIIFGLLMSKKIVEKYINYNFLIIVFLINLLGLYKSYTRGAWIAVLIGVTIFFLQKNLKWFLGSVIVVCLLGIIAYFAAGHSMVRVDNDSTRIGQWKAAIVSFKERPLLGAGYLNFEHISQDIKRRYGFPEPEFSGHAHNNFFEMLGSTGGLGFLCYVTWLLLWIVEMIKRKDIIGKIGVPFIVTFVVGGLTQSTISLGINLFFIMGAYSISQINYKSYT